MKTVELVCYNCKKTFKKPAKEYNRRVRLKTKRFFCSVNCCGIVLGKESKMPIVEKECPWCKKKFDESSAKKSRRCCSITCARKYSRSKCKNIWITKEFKDKVSEKSKASWQNPEYVRKQLANNSAIRMSKGELEIKKHFQEKFPNDGWTHGPCKIDDQVLVRDLFSKKHKVCIEYDGIWHFKDIRGQVKDKQRKDLLLEKWCAHNGYRLIRIREEVYKKDKEKWLKELEEEVYGQNCGASVAKIY